MYEAFVYCWTDNKTGMLYIGSHKGAIDDGYVCSSKTMLHEYYKRPEDFTRQIIAEGSHEDIFTLEYKILQSLDVRNDKLFYNQHNGNGDFRNKFHTEESKQKISKNRKNKCCGKEHKNYGKPRSDEVKNKISKKLQGHFVSDETKNKISKSVSLSVSGEKNPMFGKTQTAETKEIIKIKAKNRERKTCEVCGKTMDISNFNRHKHGINCNRGKEIY